MRDEGQKPLELAQFVQKRIALGDTQAVIAKRLGKSRQWVTLATALIEAPDWSMALYREGRCRGMAELYELRRLHGEHPQFVEAWVWARSTISRDGIGRLREELSDAVAPSTWPALSAASATTQQVAGPQTPTTRDVSAPSAAAHNARVSPRLHVELDGQDYQLVLSVAPSREGYLYVRPLAGGPRKLAPAAALKLRGFVVR